VAKKLRETIGALISSEVAEQTRILYGGSVKSANVAGFLASSDVDGVLVGGASLLVDEFTGICRFQKHVSL
jgi:triosephosphate isomerase